MRVRRAARCTAGRRAVVARRMWSTRAGDLETRHERAAVQFHAAVVAGVQRGKWTTRIGRSDQDEPTS